MQLCRIMARKRRGTSDFRKFRLVDNIEKPIRRDLFCVLLAFNVLLYQVLVLVLFFVKKRLTVLTISDITIFNILSDKLI